MVAIGDSIMEGHGLDPGQAWPALLAQEYGWRLTNLASDGSGFVTPGNNGDTFADQVAVGGPPESVDRVRVGEQQRSGQRRHDDRR